MLKKMNRKNLWNKWIKIAGYIGTFQMMLILWLVYFFLLMPFSLFFTIFKDPLKIKRKPSTNWITRKNISNVSNYLKDQ